jgi:hypothetical protein
MSVSRARGAGSLLAMIGFAAVCAIPIEARAEASRVVILGDERDPEVAALVRRLRAELGAAGFEIVVVPMGPSPDPRAAVEGADARAFASVHVTRAKGGVDVWIADRATGKTSVRHLEGKSPAEVALQVVELLRASLAELSVRPATRPESGSPEAEKQGIPDDVARFAKPVGAAAGATTESARGAVRFDARAALFASAHAWSIAPSLGMAWQPGALRVGVVFIGPSAASGAIERAVGTAHAEPMLGLAELAWVGSGALAPAFGLSAGALRLRARGEATATGFRGVDDATWSIALAASAELRANLGAGVWLVLGARCLIASPAPAVAIGDDRVRALGPPALLTTFGVEVRP